MIDHLEVYIYIYIWNISLINLHSFIHTAQSNVCVSFSEIVVLSYSMKTFMWVWKWYSQVPLNDRQSMCNTNNLKFVKDCVLLKWRTHIQEHTGFIHITIFQLWRRWPCCPCGFVPSVLYLRRLYLSIVTCDVMVGQWLVGHQWDVGFSDGKHKSKRAWNQIDDIDSLDLMQHWQCFYTTIAGANNLISVYYCCSIWLSAKWSQCWTSYVFVLGTQIAFRNCFVSHMM